MASDTTLIPELQKRRLELLKELHAIDTILSAHETSDKPDGDQPKNSAKISSAIYEGGSLGYHSTRDEHIAQLRDKTSDVTWKDYIYKAVKLLAPVNSNAIVDLINDANDHKIPDERVREATSLALRELLGAKKIAKQRGNPREGHLYYVIE